jgi:hypothetical protein
MQGRSNVATKRSGSNGKVSYVMARLNDFVPADYGVTIADCEKYLLYKRQKPLT